MSASTDSQRMEKIVSLCKRRGFIFQSSEIYGGFNGAWDYGPLGVELKRNLKNYWWRVMVHERDDVVGMDGAILTHPAVLKASGHVEGFSDPMIDCRTCKAHLRADQLVEKKGVKQCPNCGGKDLTEARQFNLMFETHARLLTRTLLSVARNAFSYAPLRIVARVPITPTCWLRVACNAARAPGSITPITGTGNFLVNKGSATDETVLHATTSAFASFCISICANSSAYRCTVSGLFGPYGTRAVSPR